MITYDLDARGFKRYAPIEGDYGGEASIYESSSAEDSKLWLNVTEPNDLNAWATGDRSAGTHEATLHLTPDQAAGIRDTLDYALEHHYQGDARPHGPLYDDEQAANGRYDGVDSIASLIRKWYPDYSGIARRVVDDLVKLGYIRADAR